MTIEGRLRAKRARILINSRIVGQLDMIASDAYRFTYNDTYRSQSESVPISLSLPLSAQKFNYETLPPFFDNLLMEGRLVRRMCREYGLDPRVPSDRFKLLMVCADDLIGGLTIQPLGNDGSIFPELKKIEASLTSDSRLPMISAYPNHCPICIMPGSLHPSCSQKLTSSKAPLSIAVRSGHIEDTFRVIPAGASISGAQDKNIFRVKKGLFLPELPSTHIIKPEGEYLEMPANEHLTMTIARRAKFNVPWTGLFRVEGLGLIYVIKRFDRQARGERILLEDFAQILKYLEVDKEEGSLEDIATAINQYCTSPMIEKSDFFRRVLFSFVFGNGDMHMKNWSIAYDAQSQLYKLSPVYDWLNVRAAMPSERVETVLPLGGKRNGLSKSDFEAFALTVLKLNSNFINLCFEQIPSWVSSAIELCRVSALSEKMKGKYLDVVEERSARLLGV